MKRIISLLLCLVLLVSTVPALAASLTPEDVIGTWKVTKEIMDLANEGALLNSCPPFYRGEEVSDDVIDSEYFVGYEFKKNLLRVQQAIIVFCMKK